jgi:hypothetical protein
MVRRENGPEERPSCRRIVRYRSLSNTLSRESDSLQWCSKRRWLSDSSLQLSRSPVRYQSEGRNP